MILVAEASQASTSIKLFNIFRIEERVLIQQSRLERKKLFSCTSLLSSAAIMSKVMTITPSRSTTANQETPTLMPSRIVDKKARQEFQVGALLGTGGFAKVFLVTNSSTGEACADKVIDKKVFKEKRSAKSKVEKEILIHRQLEHKHVVKFLWHFEDRTFVHIFLELCPSKTLLHVCRYQFAEVESFDLETFKSDQAF